MCSVGYVGWWSDGIFCSGVVDGCGDLCYGGIISRWLRVG